MQLKSRHSICGFCETTLLKNQVNGLIFLYSIKIIKNLIIKIMKNYPAILLIFALLFLLGSCAAIGGIFKAGVGVGIFVVIAVIVVIVLIIRGTSKTS